jgi:histone-lysine N-methyltransferase SETD3
MNNNQRLAMDYRKNQLQVLESVWLNVSAHLEQYNCSGTLCQRLQAGTSAPTIEIVSLQCAYGWLNLHYSEIYDVVALAISSDQEEPLPLNWAVLLEDWDHTYWVVWLFIVWTIWTQDREAFESSHPKLRTWLKDMNE